MKASKVAVRQMRALERQNGTLDLILEVLRMKFGDEVIDEAMTSLGLLDEDSAVEYDIEEGD